MSFQLTVPFAEDKVKQMMSLLKLVKLVRKSPSSYILVEDLKEALSLCIVPSHIVDSVNREDLFGEHYSYTPASVKTMSNYIQQQNLLLDSDEKFKLTDKVKGFLQRFKGDIENNTIVLPEFQRTHLVKLSSDMYQNIKKKLKNFPTTVSHDIAKQLTNQILSSDKGSTNIALHGTPYDRLEQKALEIANALKPLGYHQVVNVDCSRFDGQTERFVFTGSQSVWSGSREGLLTRPVFNDPKTVIILNNVQDCNPEVTVSLLSALQQGIMVDEYGLVDDDEEDRRDRYKGREPTTVNFEDVVFITTHTLGYEEYHRPSFQKKYQENPAFAKALLVDKMRQATRYIRGKMVSCYNANVLAELSKNMLLVHDNDWQQNVSQQKIQLQHAIEQQLLRWSFDKISISDDVLTALTQAFLLNRYTLQQSAMAWAEILLSPLMDKLLDKKFHADQVKIIATPKALSQIDDFLRKVGDQPQVNLLKRGVHLVSSFDVYRQQVRLTSVTEMVIANHQTMNEDDKIRVQMDYPEVRFADVKGHEEIKQYLQEIHFYMKNAGELQQLDIAMPKGVLLYGRAGTGKTMLAKALAGEAQLPFVAITGSDLLYPENMEKFMQMVNSVSPCVVFIDEADGLGSRDTSSVHANAINQLLPFIEGFHTDVEQSRFFVLASNYPDRIDTALLRAGRIEDRFEVGDMNDTGRQYFLDKILPYYDDNVKQNLAMVVTDGLNGSEMSRLHRASVLQHLRSGKQLADKTTFINLVNQIRLKLSQMPNDTSSNELQKVIAVHEIGHAFVRYHLQSGQINYISLVGNDEVGGYVNVSHPNKQAQCKSYVKDYLACLLGGYASEVVVFGEVSIGANDDLEKASKRAWDCISRAGLDDEAGLINVDSIFDKDNRQNSLDEKRLAICENWLQQAKQQAIDIITENQDLVEYLADKLIEEKVIDGETFNQLIQHYQQGENVC